MSGRVNTACRRSTAVGSPRTRPSIQIERLLSLASMIEMPEQAAAALTRLKATDAAARDAMVRAVLADPIPAEALAEAATSPPRSGSLREAGCEDEPRPTDAGG